jgi:16S rRNA (uracil1498-N3)-methyltransferase
MHSFWVENLPEPGIRFQLDKEEETHLFRILRARPGEQVRVLDGKGGIGIAEVLPDKILTLLSGKTVEKPALQLILCCAAPRRQKLDTLFKQATELGVTEIHLMHCTRSVAKPEGSSRWPALLQEACKQSGNPFLPEVCLHDSLTDALAALADANLYFGAVTPPGTPFPTVPAVGRAVFMAGPEGGFTEEEEAEMINAGAQGISLGPWILRLETAAVAGLAALRTAAK